MNNSTAKAEPAADIIAVMAKHAPSGTFTLPPHVCNFIFAGLSFSFANEPGHY
jgi:hypothetical protein